MLELTTYLFGLFFIICFLVYFILPARMQWGFLLVASLVYFFVSAKPWTFLYVLCSVLVVYAVTNYFEKTSDEKKKKGALVCGILVNVLLLVCLKYLNLFVGTINAVRENLALEQIPLFAFAAPLAISFYTLSLLSYLLDCYWGMAKPFKNPCKLLLYTIYFPLMISGPVCRYSDLGTALFEPHTFDYTRVTRGLRRVAWGLVKKLVISNRVGFMVGILAGDPETFCGIYVWITTFLYVLELYADFSGCMDIVQGLSECFGITLPDNFKAPFYAVDIQEFWRRWHITLGAWLKDYIMTPILRSKFCEKLGKSAVKTFGKKTGRKVPVYYAMLILWLAMGLWHGNSWKYILGEGVWFWLVIVLGQMLEKPLTGLKKGLHIKDGKVWRAFCRVRTFLIFSVGMLFFRAESLPEAFALIGNSFKYLGTSLKVSYCKEVAFPAFGWANVKANLGSGAGLLAFGCGLIAFLLIDRLIYKEKDLQKGLEEKPFILRWILYYIAVACILLSVSMAAVNFTYAQF